MGTTFSFKHEDEAVKRKMLLIAVLSIIFLIMFGVFMNMLVEEKKESVKEAIFESISDLPAPSLELAVDAGEIAEESEVVEEEYEYYEPVYYYNSYWYESDDADAEAAAKEWIAWRESGGDYNATNGRYIGRYQLDSSYLNGDYSEENQEATAEAYIADRYGSWQAAQEHWREYGWY